MTVTTKNNRFTHAWQNHMPGKTASGRSVTKPCSPNTVLQQRAEQTKTSELNNFQIYNFANEKFRKQDGIIISSGIQMLCKLSDHQVVRLSTIRMEAGRS